ncbi:MAG: type II toxin-antitoxin system RelE/ParE family toxin [Actinomycetota bacterium]
MRKIESATPSAACSGPTNCKAITADRWSVGSRGDIIFDVMWSVELEPEVEQWMRGLTVHDFASVLPHVERLAERGNLLRMPASRALGDGLFELRFDVLRVAWRITYFFAAGRRIVLLTVFHKQRQNERAEVQRARWAMTRCMTEGHTAEEDD